MLYFVFLLLMRLVTWWAAFMAMLGLWDGHGILGVPTTFPGGIPFHFVVLALVPGILADELIRISAEGRLIGLAADVVGLAGRIFHLGLCYAMDALISPTVSMKGRFVLALILAVVTFYVTELLSGWMAGSELEFRLTGRRRSTRRDYGGPPEPSKLPRLRKSKEASRLGSLMDDKK